MIVSDFVFKVILILAFALSVAGITSVSAGGEITVSVESDNGSNTDDIDIKTGCLIVFLVQRT